MKYKLKSLFLNVILHLDCRLNLQLKFISHKLIVCRGLVIHYPLISAGAQRVRFQAVGFDQTRLMILF